MSAEFARQPFSTLPREDGTSQRVVADDLAELLRVLPPHICEPLQDMERRRELLEVVMDLGREPEARFPGDELILSERAVSDEDLEYVIQRIGAFGGDNRAGIERTLHRISAIRNREGRVVGLTCRVGRAVFGTIGIIRDLVESGRSILMMGRPGVGKTTMLREAARVLADDLKKRVIIVDTSNEIGGDGDIPHPAIGRARRMQVVTPTLQHAVMIEAVENHMPEVIVIDEIGTELEAQAARTIAERGVQLIATAHGNTLENLMLNPTLCDLVGGVQSVTLSDEEARRRGTQKSVLERKAPPTFDVVVEIHNWNRVAVHADVAETVDALLRGFARPALVRYRDEQGELRTEEPISSGRGQLSLMREDGYGRRREAPEERLSREGGLTRRGHEAGRAAPEHAQPGVRIYPYGVNRTKLEQLVRGLPAIVTYDLDDADVVLTIKNYYRRKPQPLRDAESAGTPIYVLRSSSAGQIDEAVSRIIHRDMATPGSIAGAALQETEDAIARVLDDNQPVELSPQGAYIRRLQHQLAEQYNLGSRSAGREPYRRVQIFKRVD
jgi:stage III sporulation protein SpoIIIAA/DNA-binding NarL/FixJ family response regulator